MKNLTIHGAPGKIRLFRLSCGYGRGHVGVAGATASCQTHTSFTGIVHRYTTRKSHRLFRLANRENAACDVSRLVLLVTGHEQLAHGTGMGFGLRARRKATFPHLPPVDRAEALS